MLNVSLRNNILNLITAKVLEINVGGTGECYLGLSTTEPNDNGSNFSEPWDCPSYKRTRLNINEAMEWVDVWGKVENGSVSNKTEICTTECQEATWGVFTHFGIFGSEKGGTPLAFDLLTDPDGVADENGVYPPKSLEITKNKVAVFRVGTLQLKLI